MKINSTLEKLKERRQSKFCKKKKLPGWGGGGIGGSIQVKNRKKTHFQAMGRYNNILWYGGSEQSAGEKSGSSKKGRLSQRRDLVS